MAHLKFDPAKLDKLNDPGRFDTLKPDVLVAAMRLDSPATIIEIGAGTGMFSAELSRRLSPSTVYAVDSSEVMVVWMREHRSEVASGSVTPVLSAEKSVPLDDAIADGVFMINLHHELAEPEAIYAEAYRLVAPGGRILVADWAPTETPQGPPLRVRATPEAIAAMLEATGFVDVATHDGLPWHSLVTATRPCPDRSASSA